MGKPTGFMEIERRDRPYEKVDARKKTWTEFVKPLPYPEVARQAARCMDCGIPFCHQGCPVNNMIPDWNNLVYREQWKSALETLHSTNNFPEFTGRICPAPCEESCTLNIDDKSVTIKTIECEMHDAVGKRWIHLSRRKTGARRGDRLRPAGLACAQQVARRSRGHSVRRRCVGGCCATAFRTSRWRSAISTGACARWKPKASNSVPASKSV
jgi:glutamate synthase (NADPH/NADH) small chain